MFINNFVSGAFVPPAKENYMPVTTPMDNSEIAKVAVSDSSDVAAAVKSASDAFPKWSGMTIKARASIMLRFHALVNQHAKELAELIVKENGKNYTEALADVAKGNETVEYACSLPQVAQGRSLRVSGRVYCEDRRDPLGVVASIVPFNFPAMVPAWTYPIALVMGNTFVLKPSEKVPLTMNRIAELFKEAGLPDGVFNMVQGTREAVEAIIDHPDVKAVTFVGSSPVAKIVADRCRSLNKRVTALGGAKNHLIALEDCDVEETSSDVVVSFAGAKGERCMMAGVLLLIGEQPDLLDKIVSKALAIEPGTAPGQMGPVITPESHKNIVAYIEDSEKNGAKVLVDGRSWTNENGGNWIGPTVLLHQRPTDKAMTEEIFGPVLSVYVCSSWEEAISIENKSPFGNASSVYTNSGAGAEFFTSRLRAGMLGVNIGIPVPREPFSFGGLYGTKSKYGDMDITGDGGIEFFSNRIKITTKWPKPKKMKISDGTAAETDRANFAGQM